MEKLTNAQRELVAIGAAIGSNCVPCIEYHVPEARKAGLTDRQIDEAIRLADKIRQVPARKVLTAALGLVAQDGETTHAAGSGCDREQPASDSTSDAPCCG